MGRYKMNSFVLKLLLLVLLVGVGTGCGKKSVQGSQSTVQTADESSIKSKKTKKPKKMTYGRLLKSDNYNLKYRAALDLYKQKKNDKVITLLEDVMPYFSGTAQEDTVVFYTAVSNFRRGDFDVSGMLLDEFRKRFTRSQFIEEAEYLYAMGYYYASPRPERDQTTTIMGIKAFNEYLDRYPQTHKRAECDSMIVELTQKLYDKALLNSKVYFNVGYHKSAVHSLKQALSEQPNTTHREELLYLITKSSYILAENSIPELQHSRYLDMIDAYYNLISEFPETKHKKEVIKMYEQAQNYIKKINKTETEENGNQEK